MSKTQNPNEQADLSTPNAQEFLTSATSKSGKPTILVNYPALLKASGDDKALAYSRLKNTDSVNFDFGILDHELGNDPTAAFDALASQNAILAGYKSEDEKKQKTAARAKFAENLAKSTDANADYLTQKKAQAAVYDYIGTQGFNEDESEAQNSYKNEVVKPFQRQVYDYEIQSQLDEMNKQGFGKITGYINTAEKLENESGIFGSKDKKKAIIDDEFSRITNDDFKNFIENYNPTFEKGNLQQRWGENVKSKSERDFLNFKNTAQKAINSQNFDVNALNDELKEQFLRYRAKDAEQKMREKGGLYQSLRERTSKNQQIFSVPYPNAALRDSFGNILTPDEKQYKLGTKRAPLGENIADATFNTPLGSFIAGIANIPTLWGHEKNVRDGEVLQNYNFYINKDKNVAEIEENIRAKALQAREQGIELSSKHLTQDERIVAAMKGFKDGFAQNKNKDFLGLSAAWAKMTRNNESINEAIKNGLEFISTEAVIASKPESELTREDKKYIIRKEDNLTTGLNRIIDGDDSDTIHNGYSLIRGGTKMPIYSAAAEQVKNFNEKYNLVNISGQWVWQKLGGEVASKEETDRFLQNINTLTKALQFDGAKIGDKGQLQAYKTLDNGEYIEVDLHEGFIHNLPETFKNNLGSLLGAIGGEMAYNFFLGDKKKAALSAGQNLGKLTRLKNLGKRYTPAAIGSGIGATGDYINYCLNNGLEIDFKEMLLHGIQDSAFSVAGDMGIHGLIKGVKYLDDKFANASLGNAAKGAGKKITSSADFLAEHTPIVGAIYRFAKNAATDNIKGAESIIAANKELSDLINETYESYGGRVAADDKTFLQGVADKAKAKFGENSKEANLAQGLFEAINHNSIKDRQRAMLEYIRADESGRSLGILAEVANKSPQVQANLRVILNATSADLKNKLKNLGVNNMDIKKIFDDFESAVGRDYDEAMDEVLAKIYPKDLEIYRVEVDKTEFNDLLAAFADEKKLITDESKIFKQEIVDALFNSGKLSFSELNNIRKILNEHTRKLLNKQPSFSNTLSLQAQAKLRTAIDNAIKEIFSQNKTAFAKASELYNTALKEYGEMKELLKIIDDLNVRAAGMNEAQAVEKIVQYAMGQGEEGLANLAKLTRHLTPENRAVVEMNMLQNVFEKCLYKDEAINLEVFDPTLFFKRLKELTGENGEKAVFESKQAKEFIKMAEDFNILFKKDAEIARKLHPAKPEKAIGEESNFATTGEQKFAMLKIKLLFGWLARNCPDFFFLPESWKTRFSNAALRYHLEKALLRSGTIDEFKKNFSEGIKRSAHSSKVNQIIKEFNAKFDEVEDIAKMSDDEVARAFNLDENGNPRTNPPDDDGNGGGFGGGSTPNAPSGTPNTPQSPNAPTNSGGGSLLERARAANAEKRAAQQADQKKWDDFDAEVENAQFDTFWSKPAGKTAQETAQETAQNAAETATARNADDLAQNSQKFTQNEPQNTAQDDILAELDELDKNNPFERAMREKRAEQNSQVTPPNVKVVSETTAQSAPSTPAAAQNAPTSTANGTSKAVYDMNMETLQNNLKTAEKEIANPQNTPKEKAEWQNYKRQTEQDIANLKAANPEHAAAEQISQETGENATKNSQNSQVFGENEHIQGENFITENPNLNPATSDLSVKMELAPNVRNLAKLKDDEIMADLDFLAQKHPEMFEKPSEVFKLLREIKENPTHFYNNNRLDAALIVKRLENDKIGKMAVSKDTGKVIHATKVDDKDLKRLEKVSKAHEQGASALSKLSSDKVANEPKEQLGLPSGEIIPNSKAQSQVEIEKTSQTPSQSPKIQLINEINPKRQPNFSDFIAKKEQLSKDLGYEVRIHGETNGDKIYIENIVDGIAERKIVKANEFFDSDLINEKIAAKFDDLGVIITNYGEIISKNTGEVLETCIYHDDFLKLLKNTKFIKKANAAKTATPRDKVVMFNPRGNLISRKATSEEVATFADGEISLVKVKNGTRADYYDPMSSLEVGDPIELKETMKINNYETLLRKNMAENPKIKAFIKNGVNEKFYSPYQRELAEKLKREFAETDGTSGGGTTSPTQNTAQTQQNAEMPKAELDYDELQDKQNKESILNAVKNQREEVFSDGHIYDFLKNTNEKLEQGLKEVDKAILQKLAQNPQFKKYEKDLMDFNVKLRTAWSNKEPANSIYKKIRKQINKDGIDEVTQRGDLTEYTLLLRARQRIIDEQKYRAVILSKSSDFIEYLPEINAIKFKDKNGNEHILSYETRSEWENFIEKSTGMQGDELAKYVKENGKMPPHNFYDDFSPKIPDEVAQKLGKPLIIKMGSLLKIVAQGRENLIPALKDVFVEPDIVLKDSENGILFAKRIWGDDDYVVNVSVDKGEAFISISNGIKSTNNLKNKLENNAEILYQSPNANSNLQTLLQTSRYSANRTDSEIIPQNKAESQGNLEKTSQTPQKQYSPKEKAEWNLQNAELIARERGFNSLSEFEKHLSENEANLVGSGMIIRGKNGKGVEFVVVTQGKGKNAKKIIRAANESDFKELKRYSENADKNKEFTDYKDNLRFEIMKEPKGERLTELRNKAQKLNGALYQKYPDDYYTKGAADVAAKHPNDELVKEWQNAIRERDELETELLNDYNARVAQKEREIFGENAAKNSQNSQKFTQISTNGASDSPSVLRQEAEARIDELINNQTQIVNKNDGRVAQISVEGRKKMLGTRALEKSIGNKFKARHHFKACEKIKELFEKSEFLESEPPKNGSADIKAVHRYVANVEIDGKQAQALLTLKENASDEIGNRIYSLELQELRPLPNAQARTELTQQGQSNLTLAEDASAKNTSEAIEKTDGGIIPQNETKSQGKLSEISSEAEKKKAAVKQELGLSDCVLNKRADPINEEKRLELAKNQAWWEAHDLNNRLNNELPNERNLNNDFRLARLEIVKKIVKKFKLPYVDADLIIKAIKEHPNDPLAKEWNRQLEEVEEIYERMGILYEIHDEINKERIKAWNLVDLRKEQIWGGYGGYPLEVDTDKAAAENYLYKWNSSSLNRKKDFDEVYNELFVKRRGQVEQDFEITPLKEFGTNYAEFYRDGTGAVKKLLAEADEVAKSGAEFNGQVAGAFYRDELGDIDLVWGNDSKGLKRILATKDGEQIADIIERGEVQINGTRGTISSERGTLAVEKQGERWILDSADGTNGGGTTSRTASETAQTATNAQNLGENLSSQSQVFSGKNLKNYQDLVYFLEDNLQKRANSYIDFGGGTSGKVKGATTGQHEQQRFMKSKILDDLNEFLQIKAAPREISEQAARDLAFKKGKLDEQELSDLFAYLKTHTDGKILKESQIYYKLAEQIKDDLIAVYERDLGEIARAYGLKDYESNALDFEKFRYKDIKNNQRKDKRGATFFRDLAETLSQMLKESEPPIDRIKEYEFLLENIPNYKHLDGAKRTNDILSDFNGMKQRQLLETLQDENFMSKIENLSDDEAAAAVKNESLERAKEDFRRKYFYDYENSQKGVNFNENSQNLSENLAKNGENLGENSAAQTQKNLIDEPQAQKAAPASEPKTSETPTQNTAQAQPQKQGYTLQDALNYYDEFLTRLSDYFNEQVARGYMKEASAKRLMGKVKTMWKKHKGYFEDGYERNTKFGMPYLNSQSGEMEMQSAFARILGNLEKVKMTKGNRLDISSFSSKNYYFLNLDELKAKGKPTKTADDEFRKNLLKQADKIDNGGGTTSPTQPTQTPATSRTASETATNAQNLGENLAKNGENLGENSAAQTQKNLIDEPQAQKADEIQPEIAQKAAADETPTQNTAQTAENAKIKELETQRQQLQDEFISLFEKKAQNYDLYNGGNKFITNGAELLKRDIENLQSGKNKRTDIPDGLWFGNSDLRDLHDKITKIEQDIEFEKIPREIRQKYDFLSKDDLTFYYADIFQSRKERNPNITFDEVLRDTAKIRAENLKKEFGDFGGTFNSKVGSDKEILEFKAKYRSNKRTFKKVLADLTETLNKRRTYLNTIFEKIGKKPIAEFGQNYVEFYRDGVGAVKKLLAEADEAAKNSAEFNGQVAGAFYRDELGDIDLVWGKNDMGLQKIIKKHLNDFRNFDGATPNDKLANGIDEIIRKGTISPTYNGYNITLDDFVVGLNRGFNKDGVKIGENKWVVTAFDSTPNKQGVADTARFGDIAEGSKSPSNLAEKNSSEKNLQSQGAKEIQQKIQQKFGKDENYARDLYEWHKDSSPLTKDEDGTPKVFYHGSVAKFETFKSNPQSFGIWLTGNKDEAMPRKFNKNDEIYEYEVFVKCKKIYNWSDEDIEKVSFIGEPYTETSEQSFNNLKKAGYDGIYLEKDDILIVFNPNQIKAVENKGGWTDGGGNITPDKPQGTNATHKYFNESSSNIYRSSEIWGSGLAGGTLNGLETDENGNIIGFNPQNFIKGFLAGAGGAKAVKLAIQKSPAIRAKAEKFAAKSAEFLNEALQNPLMLPQERARFAVVANKALNSALDNRKFIIGGEGAIGANREKLARARVMQKQGKDEGEIWDKTGWYLDKDGKWKFEINAEGGEWIQEPTENARGKLSDFLEDDELFAAYPQLQDYKVEFKNLPGGLLGTFDETTKTLEICLTYEDRMKSTLYHELQHAVQHIENFARGGNPQSARAALKRPENQHLVSDLVAKYKDKKTLGQKAYERLHGEVEARNVEERMDKWDKISWGFDEDDGELLDLAQGHPHGTMDEALQDTIIVQDKRRLRGKNSISQSKETNENFIKIKTKNENFKTLKDNFDEKYTKAIKNNVKFTNDETKITATLARAGIKEIINNVDKSVKNGFTFNAHFAVALDLENVFKKAKYLGKFDDIKNGDPNVSIHRFKSAVLINDNKTANALLLLKEWRENGKRIYSLKLDKLEKGD